MSHFYDLDQIKYRRQPKYFRKGNLAAAARRSRGRKRLLIARTLLLPPFYVNSGQILDETQTFSSVNFSYKKAHSISAMGFGVMEEQCSIFKWHYIAKMWNSAGNFVRRPNNFCNGIVQQLFQNFSDTFLLGCKNIRQVVRKLI